MIGLICEVFFIFVLSLFFLGVAFALAVIFAIAMKFCWEWFKEEFLEG